MRIFVSSTYEDLREHRAAAIRVLRQLGHEVLAMEDMVAGSVPPLNKVLDMIDRSEAYVGIFAWRYGYVPGRDQPAPAPSPQHQVQGAAFGTTSITHYEYLRAIERKLPVMAFLLDESYSWPPQLIDGFDRSRPQAPHNTDQIRALRQQLQQERVVSSFTTPSDLEARVSAAVTMAGLTRQLNLLEATALAPGSGTDDSSAETGIKDAIVTAGQNQQRALKISLATTWWSTRLFLIAALAERLTQVRRILIVESKIPDALSRVQLRPPVISSLLPPAGPMMGGPPVPPAMVPKANPPAAPATPIAEERFVGQLSTGAILSTIGPKVNVLHQFQMLLQARPVAFNDVATEIHALIDEWRKAFSTSPPPEDTVKVDLTPELLRRWFGDAMLRQPIHISDLQRASVVDLLRLLDYPNEYVPILTRSSPTGDVPLATERVDVMDKNALNARLARSYLLELMDRARIV